MMKTIGEKRNISEISSDTIKFEHYEKDIPKPGNNQIRLQKDYGKGKAFANTTWETAYGKIKGGYDSGEYEAYYEQREPGIPCNFHTDIDDEVESENDFNEDEYLKNIRNDFNSFGITEPWKLQRSCGPKGDKYKISYHITIPGVRFKTHKYLKQWFLKRCTKKLVHGKDKNGKNTTKPEYLLGTTKIDMNVYCKGAWRFPMCAKQDSTRVLEYKDEDMSLEVFKKLSIHHIEPNARSIDVELPKQITVRRKQISLCEGTLTEDEKEIYQLKGDFIWGNPYHGGGQYIKAVSDNWHCAFDIHESNKQVVLNGNKIYCHGCEKDWVVSSIENGGIIPPIPDILPPNLYLGTDECYAYNVCLVRRQFCLFQKTR